MEPRVSVARKPAVLFVHGGFHLPVTYTPFLDRLSNAGFTVRCPYLKTSGDAEPPSATFQSDVAAVRNAAWELVCEGHKITVLSHSYGGLVASEAVTGELYAKDGMAGVIQLIYVSAWLVPKGTIVPEMVNKYGHYSSLKVDPNEYGMARPINGREAFYHDIRKEEAEELTKKLVTQNLAALQTPISHSPWMDLPTLYVHCTIDMALGFDLQRIMVDKAIKSGAGAFNVRTLESSHSPFWSMPVALLRIVEDAWRPYRDG